MGNKIKQDINFQENPLWFQDVRQEGDERGVVWKDIEGYVYRAGYRLPTKTDFIFILALLHICQQNDWSKEVVITRNQVLKKCGISPNKRWYDRFEESLKRWINTTVEFKGTFYNGHTYESICFNIINDFGTIKSTKKISVEFNEKWLIRIKDSRYYKLIDFEEIKKIKSPLATRLHEILSKSFHKREEWQIDAHKLAAKIPMAQVYLSDIIRQIKPAINRISAQTDLKINMTVQKRGRGQATLVFEKTSGKTATQPQKRVAQDPQPPMQPAPPAEEPSPLDALTDTQKAELRAKALEGLAPMFRRREFVVIKRMEAMCAGYLAENAG